MKKSKIVMAVGAFALAITAVFATKANKKFGAFNTAFFGPSGNNLYVKGLSAFPLTTNSGIAGVKPLYGTIYTSTSQIHTLLEASDGNPLYFN